MSRKGLQAEKKKLEAALGKVNKLIAESTARSRVRCEGPRGCGRTTVVSALTYLQTHWYTRPHSCTGGDCWSKGEGQFVCPKCGVKNRLYNRPDVVALKPFFKSAENVYDK